MGPNSQACPSLVSGDHFPSTENISQIPPGGHFTKVITLRSSRSVCKPPYMQYALFFAPVKTRPPEVRDCLFHGRGFHHLEGSWKPVYSAFNVQKVTAAGISVGWLRTAADRSQSSNCRPVRQGVSYQTKSIRKRGRSSCVCRCLAHVILRVCALSTFTVVCPLFILESL